MWNSDPSWTESRGLWWANSSSLQMAHFSILNENKVVWGIMVTSWDASDQTRKAGAAWGVPPWSFLNQECGNGAENNWLGRSKCDPSLGKAAKRNDPGIVILNPSKTLGQDYVLFQVIISLSRLWAPWDGTWGRAGGGPGWGRSKVYVTHAIMYEVKVASSCLSLRGRHFLECLIGSGQLVLWIFSSSFTSVYISIGKRNATGRFCLPYFLRDFNPDSSGKVYARTHTCTLQPWCEGTTVHKILFFFLFRDWVAVLRKPNAPLT